MEHELSETVEHELPRVVEQEFPSTDADDSYTSYPNAEDRSWRLLSANMIEHGLSSPEYNYHPTFDPPSWSP